MAIGDKARAAGLTTYSDAQDRRLGYENDNQNADYIAEDRDRLAELESFVDQPMFSTYRGFAQNAPNSVWTVVASATATPDLNAGFSRWDRTSGELVVFRPGVYRLSAHVQFIGNDYTAVGVQITRNTTAVDTANTVAKGETAGPAADASSLRRFDQGDIMRMLVLQRNAAGAGRNIGANAFDLAFAAEWVRD